MCRNNGPASLTKINKTATKGVTWPILLLSCHEGVWGGLYGVEKCNNHTKRK